MPIYLAIPVCIAVLLIGTWSLKNLLESGGIIESQEARDFSNHQTKL